VHRGGSVSDKTLKALGAKELQSSTIILCGPDQRPIEVMVKFSATLFHKEWSCVHPVFVVKTFQ